MDLRRIGLLALLMSGLAASVGHSQEWTPPTPPKDKFDWVQLSSGEWLKGELKGYVDDEVVFDSDKLGIQTLDREDVTFLRTGAEVRIGYQKPDAEPGKLLDRKELEVAEEAVEIKNGKLVSQSDGKVIAPMDDVATIAGGAESEWDNWAAKVSVGVNYREGNTQQLDYDAAIELSRITATSRFNFNYLGNYSQSEQIETANSHRVDFNLDRYRSPRFFTRPVFGEYYRDPFQNIGSRVLLGSGLGYEIIDTSKVSWEVAGGPAFQYTHFDSVPAGSSSTKNSAAGVIASLYQNEINDHLEFRSLYRAIISSKASGGYSHHFENSLSIELTDDLDFDISLIWDYLGNPAQDSSGSTPKNDDFRLMFMLGYEL